MMPRIIVVDKDTIYMDEQILTIHLNDDHHSVQFLERLVWAMEDAERERLTAQGLRAVN